MSHLGGNTILVVTTEVNQAVLALVAATATTRGDPTFVVAPTGLVQRTNQGLFRVITRNFREI